MGEVNRFNTREVCSYTPNYTAAFAVYLGKILAESTRSMLLQSFQPNVVYRAHRVVEAMELLLPVPALRLGTFGRSGRTGGDWRCIAPMRHLRLKGLH